MANSKANVRDEQIKYSKLISSFFCSTSIIALSILCLLNNLSIDLYSAVCLLKIVIPAAFSFWFLGFVIGTILDRHSEKIIYIEKQEEKVAYEIPSMFAGDVSGDLASDDLGDL